MVDFLKGHQIQPRKIKLDPNEITKDIELNLNEDIQDVGTSTQAYINRRYGQLLQKLKIGYVALIIVDVGAAMFWSRIFFSEPRIFFAIGVAPLVGYAVFTGFVRKNILHEFYKQFAAANNFTYVQISTIGGMSGALFRVGNSKFSEDIITGEFAGFPLRLFNYNYTIGYGKNSTKYKKTVFEIDFETPLPPVLLLQDRSAFGDDLSDNNLKNRSKVSLPKHIEQDYNLYTEKKYEIEALQVFTPDVLEYIHTNYSDFNFDFEGTKLYVYARSVIIKKEDIKRAYTLAQYLINQLSHELKNMKGSIIALNEHIRLRVNK